MNLSGLDSYGDSILPQREGNIFREEAMYAGKTPVQLEIERDALRIQVTSENMRKKPAAKLNGNG